MGNLLAALQFLTVIPVPVKGIHGGALSRSLAWFPVAGVLIGACAVAAGSLSGLLGVVEPWRNVIIAAALFLVTGGLHLDGLSDAADAAFSRKDREGMLAVMRDPHAGALGISAVIFTVLVQIALLASLSTLLRPAAVVGMCVVSRWVMVLCLTVFPYARSQGKASQFYQGPRILPCVSAGLCAAVIVFILGGFSWVVAATGATWLAYGVAWLVSRRLKGLTGDVLGALNELTQLAVLAGVLLLQKGWHVWNG